MMTYRSTVLVVDDDPIAHETLEGLLFREGYHLVFADDGSEGLQLAAELTPDVVLLDVMMPGMDGFEVCQRLRDDPLLAQVPIIMVTALDDRDSRLRAIEAGADDFVSKPFDRAELRARVRTVTRLNRYRRLLRERAKFEWAVEQAEDGYLIVSENGAILYANPQARLYFGLPPSSSSTEISVDERTSIAPSFMALARKQYQCEPPEAWNGWPGPPIDGQESPRYLVRPRTATASEFWLLVDVMEMANHLMNNHYLVRARDVTARVVKALNAWTFQGLVNHKLRSPLTAIVGYMDMLAEELPDDLDPAIASFFTAAHENILRLRDRVLKVLKAIDPLGGVQGDDDQCAPVEIPDIIAGINQDMAISSLDVTCTDDKLGGTYVLLSCQAMKLILWELLENAKKFHPQGTPSIDVQVSESDGNLRLLVCDDGQTLSPPQLIDMWTPYYQAEGGFSGEVPGMGLGLPMVATLVWGIGGTCRAHNREDGPGIVVTLDLPLER